jgi:hypothetical protein
LSGAKEGFLMYDNMDIIEISSANADFSIIYKTGQIFSNDIF